jgi:hypothetical protein
MTRSLAALACFAALFGAPAPSQAESWMYEDSFYRPYWGGYGWGAGYRGYTTGYAPFYTGYVTSYAPAYAGYGYGGACCSPCGTSCCSPCGTGCGSACGTGCGTSCDPSCGSCAGGNCATGSGTTPVESVPSGTGTGTGANPTFAPPASNDNRTNPDDFKAAPGNPALRNRDTRGTGTAAPATGGFTTPATGGANPDPNTSAPEFNQAEPKSDYFKGKDDQSRENGSVTPKVSPIESGEKVAFKTPARLTRSTLQPVFELPTIVSAPPSTRFETTPSPTVVASK